MTTGIEEPFVPIPTRRWQRRSLARNSTLRNPLTIIGLVIAVGWILIAIFAPLLSPHDPLAQTLPALHAPSWKYPFGTDELGRDVLSRTLYGARETIPIGLLLVLIAMVIGSTLGAIAGYFGGVIDGIVMRLTDLVFAFPAIVLAMVTTAARRTPGSCVASSAKWVSRSTSSPRVCLAHQRVAHLCATCCRTSPVQSLCSPRSTLAARSCCSPASRSSVSGRSRRRRSGDSALPKV
jgi:ABC-type dipeptide/oligopeptide/nickel transport system permease subunit